MAIGLIGRKCGMTRIFTEDGLSLPVTAIEIEMNRVAQIKNSGPDGYSAVQVACGLKKLSRTTKPMIGHFVKANIEPARMLQEFRVHENELTQFNVGEEIRADVFAQGQYVDVSGVSKGKGFAGTIKRHNFTMGDATHGNSKAHRSAGSIGQNQDPGKVFKGKKMAGQLGNVKKTVQSLEVVRIDVENNVILVKGSIPGATGSYVTLKPAVKFMNKPKGVSGSEN